MPKKKTVEEEMEVSMTPMIDVTFQLLIFFIITLKFKTLERKLYSYLPTDFGIKNNDVIDENVFMTVKLRQSKSSDRALIERPTNVFVENDKLDPGDFIALEARLKQFRNLQKDAIGKIDVGRGVPHAQVVAVLDVFNRTGFKTVSFVGLPRSKSVLQGKKWWDATRVHLDAK